MFFVKLKYFKIINLQIHSLTSQLEKIAVHNRRGEEKVSMEMAKTEIDMLVKFYEENQPICANPQPSQTEYVRNLFIFLY